jgi:cytidylate kinase
MKEFPKISLTGDLGSGKSHVSRLLSKALGYKIISTGVIQREIAEKMNMTTLELNEYTKTHPEIDDEIDGTITHMQSLKESFIFDSRLAWHFAPESFKVYLSVDPEEAAKRIFNDTRTSETYETVEDAMQKIQARRKSELIRFKEYYGIDYGNLSNYDLVINTSNITPEEVCGQITEKFAAWRNK